MSLPRTTLKATLSKEHPNFKYYASHTNIFLEYFIAKICIFLNYQYYVFMEKTKIIAVMAHKGGTGKTITVSSLADQFSAQGKKVLIIDCDEQSNIKTIFGIKLSTPGAEGGVAAVLLSNIKPEAVTIQVRENIDVILSGGRLMRDFEKTLHSIPDAENLMRRRFENVTQYDYILLDTAPALNLCSSNVACYADYVVIPCSPDMLSLVGVKNTVNFLESLEKSNSDLEVAKLLGVVPTFHDTRRILDSDIINDLDRFSDSGLLQNGVIFGYVRNDIKVKTSQVRKKLLTEAYPKSNAAQDYQALAKSIQERIELFQPKSNRFTSEAKNTPASV